MDVHTHDNFDRDYLGALLDEWKMRAVDVEVIKSGAPGRMRWNNMTAVHNAHPDTIPLCASFDASLIGEPDFAEKTTAQLANDFNEGAVMVKVWKNVGMVYKDSSGEFTQIDDPRFQPIWDFLVANDIPLLAHIGEPRAAWRPLDPKGPHYTYYFNNPMYHNYRHKNVPRWETIIAARDRFLEHNPKLTVIGAHLGSMAYDVDEVARRLDKYPNFYVDTAERFGDLAIQPSPAVREFFIKYADRILYGADLSTRRPVKDMTDEELKTERDGIETRLRVHWQYLTTPDAMPFVRTGSDFKTQTTGLHLPADVVEKVYALNAERLINLPEARRSKGGATGTAQ